MIFITFLKIEYIWVIPFYQVIFFRVEPIFVTNQKKKRKKKKEDPIFVLCTHMVVWMNLPLCFNLRHDGKGRVFGFCC